jgi:NAD(P)-dependent dehydrogenase (short-subunit alcohol dehydrogenase family)
MKVELEGKVALVTGSGRGIGRAIALGLARNGADIAVNVHSKVEEGLNVAREIEAMGRRSLFIKADVSSSQQVEEMTRRVVDEFGRIDILVNNAGINVMGSERVPIHEFSEAAWERVVNVDLRGVFLCSKAAAKHMIKQKKGKIVNISSVAGIAPLRLQSAYVAAKAGVLNLTRSMALELAPYAINVNAIAPGSTLTEGTKTLFYSEDKAQYPEKARDLLSHIPLGRPGAPEDIANATLFLASDDADYITGVTLVVDGGWTAGYMRDW